MRPKLILVLVAAAAMVIAPEPAASTDGAGPSRSAAQRALDDSTRFERAMNPNHFSQWFEAGKESTTQCEIWKAWLPTIGEDYSQVTWSGTQDTVGVSCSDPDAVATIAHGMRTMTAFMVECDGHTWSMCDRFDGELWLDPPAECDGANCPDGYILRPCFLSAAFWGAVGGPTCGGAPSQQISIHFQ